MRPGRGRCALGVFTPGLETATVGIACSSVHSRKRALPFSRSTIPVTTTTTITMPATIPANRSLRCEIWALKSDGIKNLRGSRLRLRISFVVDHAEDHRIEHEGCNSCENETTKHGAAKR